MVERDLRLLSAIAGFAVIACGIAMSAIAGLPITEYPIPTASSYPQGIAAGPDGNIWFTEFSASKIGKITLSGVITEYPTPTANSGPVGIAAGPDGSLWFTESNANNIGRITPDGVITEYPIPKANSLPRGITAGPDGNLWFTEWGGNQIGKITPTGVFTEYGPIAVGSQGAITGGPDGNVWFGSFRMNTAGVSKITPAGVISGYTVGFLLNDSIGGITNGPDGNLWFTLAGTGEVGGTYSYVGKITPLGVSTLYNIPPLFPPPFRGPHGVTLGADGNLWFALGGSDQIGKITVDGTITLYGVSTEGAQPFGITAGPDSDIWFTEAIGNQIGRAQIFNSNSIAYTPLEPCRIMDTRAASPNSGVQGPIVGDTLYNFPGFIAAGSDWSLFGGSGTSDCGLNSAVGVNIQAIAVVITILDPNFDAFLGVGDVNDLNTTLSTVALNYTAQQGLSTMYIVPQTLSNTIYFALPTDLSANLVFDVVGYFVTSDAAALQCTTRASAPSTISASGGTGSATSPSCAASYTLTSGSCDSDSFAMKLVSDKASAQAWFCSAINSGGIDAHLTATANCCRVPGK